MNPPLTILPADPGAGYRAQHDDIDAAVLRVLASGHYINGPEVDAFEREFAAWLGIDHAVGVGNGTDAIELTLRVLDIGHSDAVITVSHTAVATVAAIEAVGALPVLVDVEPDCYTMDPQRLEQAIAALAAAPQRLQGRRLRALIPVHLYGQAADMQAIAAIADAHGLAIIEDCAQCHGATLDGRMTGSFGQLATFSFYPTKNLGAIGDGGAVVTADPQLAARARRLREYGWQARYVSAEPGINTRLDEIQAAILRVKLARLADDNARRRSIAAGYDAGLAGLGLDLPRLRAGAQHVYHQYVLRSPARDTLREHLAQRGIGALVHYPMAVHQQPAYSGRVLVATDLAQTDALVAEILSLPMHPQLTDAQVETVIAAIADCCGHRQAHP